MIDVAVIAQFAPGTDKKANLASLRTLAAEAAGRGAKVVGGAGIRDVHRTEDGRADRRVGRGPGRRVRRGAGGDRARSSASTWWRGSTSGSTSASTNLQHPRRDRTRTATSWPPTASCTSTTRSATRSRTVIRPARSRDPETFAVDGLTFGMQTCYDLRFPEVTRRIVDAGADVLLLPAAVGARAAEGGPLATLVRARAIENTCTSPPPTRARAAAPGNSMIVDPMGVTLASLGERVGHRGRGRSAPSGSPRCARRTPPSRCADSPSARSERRDRE